MVKTITVSRKGLGDDPFHDDVILTLSNNLYAITDVHADHILYHYKHKGGDPMIDSHIHLSYRYFDQTFSYIGIDHDKYVLLSGDRNSLITNLKEQGIECCIEPAIDVDSNEILLKLSEENEGFLYPAVGNHPTRCINSALRDFKRVKEYSKRAGVIAIGETGLDYHYERREQHRLKQKMWFQWQINLADQLGLPLILHIRMANEDAIAILRKNKKKLHGGVCHCFNSGSDEAEIYTEELGLHLGIGGALLMKPEHSEALRQAVSAVPLEYLLLETDGPYVKPERPENISGKKWTRARNTSLILPAVAAKIAEIKGVTAEEVMKITADNTRRVFRLQKRLTL